MTWIYASCFPTLDLTTKIKYLIGVACLVLLSALCATTASAQWVQVVGAKISVAWPHDGLGHPTTVAQSRAVNLSIWPLGQIKCNERPNLTLLVAKDNEPTRILENLPAMVNRSSPSGEFTSFEYNDIPANLAGDPTSKYRFVLYSPVNGGRQGFAGNIWVHAADPRTYYPDPITPNGFSDKPLPSQGLDTRIQVVWPHDVQGNYAAADRATKLNITVEVFEHGTLKAVPSISTGKFQYSVSLWVAEGNGMLHSASYSTITPVTYTIAGQTFTRWTFNDVPVEVGGQYHFLSGATPLGQPNVYPYTTIWTHGTDPRTFLPRPQNPPPCLP